MHFSHFLKCFLQINDSDLPAFPFNPQNVFIWLVDWFEGEKTTTDSNLLL